MSKGGLELGQGLVLAAAKPLPGSDLAMANLGFRFGGGALNCGSPGLGIDLNARGPGSCVFTRTDLCLDVTFSGGEIVYVPINTPVALSSSKIIDGRWCASEQTGGFFGGWLCTQGELAATTFFTGSSASLAILAAAFVAGS